MDVNPYEAPKESAAFPRKKSTWKTMWGRTFFVSAAIALTSWLVWSLISTWRRTPDEWLPIEVVIAIVNAFSLLTAGVSGYAWSAIDYHFSTGQVSKDVADS